MHCIALNKHGKKISLSGALGMKVRVIRARGGGCRCFPRRSPNSIGGGRSFPSLPVVTHITFVSCLLQSRHVAHTRIVRSTVQALVLFGNGLDRAGAQGIGSGRSPCRVRGNIDSLTI